MNDFKTLSGLHFNIYIKIRTKKQIALQSNTLYFDMETSLQRDNDKQWMGDIDVPQQLYGMREPHNPVLSKALHQTVALKHFSWNFLPYPTLSSSTLHFHRDLKKTQNKT